MTEQARNAFEAYDLAVNRVLTEMQQEEWAGKVFENRWLAAATRIALLSERKAALELAQLIGPDYHVVDVQPDGWAIQHPLACRPDLISCPVHRAAMAQWSDPPGPVGRWRVDTSLQLSALD